MSLTIVFDSTCLIGFERIGHLDLLPKLYTEVVVPPAVVAEFGRQLSWMKVEPLSSPHLCNALRLTLGKGEAEAIALAVQMDGQLVTDDKQARSVAEAMGLRVVGTLGILVRAKRAGIIERVAPFIGELERNSFRISRALREEVLILAGEEEQ